MALTFTSLTIFFLEAPSSGAFVEPDVVSPSRKTEMRRAWCGEGEALQGVGNTQVGVVQRTKLTANVTDGGIWVGGTWTCWHLSVWVWGGIGDM